jgi:hypothetical protein
MESRKSYLNLGGLATGSALRARPQYQLVPKREFQPPNPPWINRTRGANAPLIFGTVLPSRNSKRNRRAIPMSPTRIAQP